MRDLEPEAFREAVLSRTVDAELDEGRAQVVRASREQRSGALMSVAIVVVLLVLAARCARDRVRFAGRPASRGSTTTGPTSSTPRPSHCPTVPEMPDVVADVDAPAVTWTAQLTAATLDEAARLRLIDDLVLLRDAWALGLLRRALDEERAPHVRARIAEALAACGESDLLAIDDAGDPLPVCRG